VQPESSILSQVCVCALEYNTILLLLLLLLLLLILLLSLLLKIDFKVVLEIAVLLLFNKSHHPHALTHTHQTRSLHTHTTHGHHIHTIHQYTHTHSPLPPSLPLLPTHPFFTLFVGFMVIDEDQRLVVLEGLAGPGRGMQSVFMDIPRLRENDAEYKMLCNPEVLFASRLYSTFG
jgi:hypothetical protein